MDEKVHASIYFLLFALAMSFYFATLAPCVMWGDSAKLTLHAIHLDLGFRSEYHPTHALLGYMFLHLFPLGDAAFKMNLLSSLFSSFTLVLLFRIVFYLTKNIFCALASFIALMTSHTFWLLSVMTETYTFLCFSTLLAFFMLLNPSRKMHLFAFFYLGFASTGNALLLFFLPAFLMVHAQTAQAFRLRRVFPLFMCFIIGTGSVILFAAALDNPSSIIQQILFSAGGGPFKQYFRNTGKIFAELSRYPFYLFYQFPGMAFIFGFIGIIKTKKDISLLHLAFLWIFLMDIFFASAYMRQRQFNLLIISYVVFAAYIGTGVLTVFQKLETAYRRNTVMTALLILIALSPLTLYYNILAVTKKFRVDIVKTRTVPYRNNALFFLCPDKKFDHGPERFMKDIFGTAEPNALIYADYVPGIVLQYYQKEDGLRKDILIDKSPDAPFNHVPVEKLDEQLSIRPVYFLEKDELEEDYRLYEVKKRYSLIPAGSMFQLKKNKTPS